MKFRLALAVLFFAATSALAAESAPWFDRLVEVEPLPEEAARDLARVVAGAFLEPESPQPLTPALEEDRAPRILFASYSDGQRTARVVHGAGMGAQEALQRLLEKRGEAAPARWVKECLKMLWPGWPNCWTNSSAGIAR